MDWPIPGGTPFARKGMTFGRYCHGQDGRDEEAEDWTEVLGGLSGFGLLPAAFQGVVYSICRRRFAAFLVRRCSSSRGEMIDQCGFSKEVYP